jgi:hypothetical protein
LLAQPAALFVRNDANALKSDQKFTKSSTLGPHMVHQASIGLTVNFVIYPYVTPYFLKEAGDVSLAFPAYVSSVGPMMDTGLSKIECVVVNGDDLPAASGGVAALCRAIDDGAARRGLDHAFAIRVSIERHSVLVGDVTLDDGRAIPSLRVADMDRPISGDMFERFGLAVADPQIGVDEGQRPRPVEDD